jgi:hypothetical protein
MFWARLTHVSVLTAVRLCFFTMLSVVILAFHEIKSPRGGTAEAVARSLSSLIDACVQGVVADAVLAGSDAGLLEKLADEAGAERVDAKSAAEGVPLALRMARRPDVFLLRAGHAVDRGFVDEVRDALSYGDLTKPLILRGAPDTVLTRLAPNLAEPVGLVARREALLAAGGCEIAALARRLRGINLESRARRVV